MGSHSAQKKQIQTSQASISVFIGQLVADF